MSASIPDSETAGGRSRRVVLVTGGGHNLGRAVAEAFAAIGDEVVVAARDRARLDATVDSIRRSGGSARAEVCDCRDPDQVDRLVARVHATSGSLDVCASFAGGGALQKRLEDHGVDEWRGVLDQNLTTAFVTARSVLPGFLARNRGVLLFAVGSGAFHPEVGVAKSAYVVANAALCRLVDQLTAENLDSGIRVHAIDPGLVLDDAAEARMRAQEQEAGKPDPLRDLLCAREQTAELALFLASDEASDLRGRCVSVRDTFWRDPEQVARVAANERLYRVWRQADTQS